MNAAPDAVLESCPACAANVYEGDVYCEACGHRLVTPAPTIEPAPAAGPDPDVIDHHGENDLGRVAAVGDRGRLRRRNEDAFAVRHAAGRVIAVVCDGVSASAVSDRAAVAASTAAADVLAAAREDGDGRADLEAAVAAAQSAVAAVPWPRDTALAPPSCTLVAGVWDGSTITVVSVGDSRAYWIGAEAAELLTTDDSWAEHQVSAGYLNAEEAARHPNAHAITRWVGVDAPDEPTTVITRHPDGPGHLVLCSDGLWNYTPTADALAEVVGAHPGATALDLARRLVAHALERGGHDNVTVAVIPVTPEEQP